MTKKYRLQKVSDREIEYLIFSVDYSRLDDYINELSNELSRKSFSGAIMFDMLLSNGLNDRYFKAHFDGKKINKRSITPVALVDENIERVSSKFYMRKPEFLENSILTGAQKFLFKRQFAN